MEQQVDDVAQPNAMPADVEAILQPISADHLQAQPTAEPAAQPVVAQPAPQPVAPPPPAEQQVPLHVLLEERRERQAYQRQIQQFIEAQQRASQPQPQPIDPVADPEGAFRALAHQNAELQRQMQEQAIHQRANTSEMLARLPPERGGYGSQAVDTARENAVKAGLGNYFLNQPEPYQALMEWHRGQVAAKEIGPDLKAWETKKEQEIEARILARLQQAAPARPGVPQVLPPSLSSATRASSVAPMVMDPVDHFKAMFAKQPRT